MLALFFAGCHREASQAPTEDKECFGARCVEQAEAAMFYKDYAGAREPLTKVCENNADGFQCFRLAELYQNGRGGPVDLEKAAQYYERSCEKEHGEACERRADLARDGLGGPQVELDYTLKACAQQRSAACHRAGKQVLDGRGIERDLPRAIELFETACGLGEVDGCTGAGDLLATPTAKPDAKSRALASFVSACVGHSAYGCLRVGVMFHDGVGTSRDVDKAKMHFAKACEWQEPDGCHAVKQIEEAGGEPVELELTTKADELAQGGLQARSVMCRMSEQGPPALGEVLGSVARHKEKLDACAKDGAAVAVTLEFEGGRVLEARIKGRASRKVAGCVVATLKKARISPTGMCEAVLLLGDPDGAQKALDARLARLAKQGDGRNHIRMADEDEE